MCWSARQTPTSNSPSLPFQTPFHGHGVSPSLHCGESPFDLTSTDPVNGAWLSLNARTPGERSVTLAIHIMSANCAGIVGKQLFRSEDAPDYPIGFGVIMALTATAVVLSCAANLQYYLCNGRKLARSGLRYLY